MILLSVTKIKQNSFIIDKQISSCYTVIKKGRIGGFLMLRKVFGGSLFALAAVWLIAAIVYQLRGSVNEHVSDIAIYGNLLGLLLPVILNVLGGIFLFRFDRVYQQNYADGFNTRRKQCPIIICFIVFYSLLYIFSVIGAVRNLMFVVIMILSFFMFCLPAVAFAFMMDFYGLPFLACQKNFNIDEESLKLYFSANEKFFAYTEDKFVIASNKILFFPKTFCIVPIDRIASAKFHKGIEKVVILMLTNGKKVKLFADERQYNGVLAAIAANKR